MNIDYTLIIILMFLLFMNRNKPNNRKYASIFLCIIFIIEAGFRDYVHSNNDTWNYWHWYENLYNKNFSDLISSSSVIYNNYEDRDPGFAILAKLLQIIGFNFRMFLIFVACTISIPLCRLLYKYVPTVNGLFLSAMIYQALFANFFNTAMRQTIAIGLCLWSLIYYERKMPLQHYFFIFLAFTIHSTALLFTPLYLIRKIDTKKILFGALLITPLTMLNASTIVAFLGKGTIFESYAINSTDNLGTPVFTSMIALITIAIAINYEKFIHYFKDSLFMIQSVAISLMLTPASWVDSNFLRITFYYLIFLLPLYPILIETVSKNNSSMRQFSYIGSLIALLFLMYR